MSWLDWPYYYALAAAFGYTYANMWLWFARGIRRCGAPNTWWWGNGGCPW